MTAIHSSPANGILDPEMQVERDELVALLETAYWLEIETLMNYLAASINPDGIRAQIIRETVAEHVGEELGHARAVGRRIKDLYGVVPGSLHFDARQSGLQPADDQTDLRHVIVGVIEAEYEAIAHWQRIVRFAEGRDPVTQDLAIRMLGDEERHRRLFEGFLRELDAQ